jgi:hypothetical protein
MNSSPHENGVAAPRNPSPPPCPSTAKKDEKEPNTLGGPPSANGANGRDKRGRFVSGNKGGPGNPFARQTAALRRALLAVVTPEDLEAVARVLVQKARDGDLAAIKLLLLYAVGRPTEAVDPDTLDIKEWDLLRQEQAPAEQLPEVMAGLPKELACHMVRAVRGPLADGKARLFARGLAQEQTPPEEATEGAVAATDPIAHREDASAEAPPGEAGGEPVRTTPGRLGPRKPPATSDGRRAEPVADEAGEHAGGGRSDGLPDVETLALLLGREFAARGEIPQESAEEFVRNLLRDG